MTGNSPGNLWRTRNRRRALITLLVVLIGIAFYFLLYRSKEVGAAFRSLTSALAPVLIGLVLGVSSSFLGIGGGPINLVVLYFFFSMETKTAAQNSLYIILFSQAASLINSIVTSTIPEVQLSLLLLMVIGGITGGIVGRKINKKINSATVDKLFIGLMAAIMLICFYNIWQFI